MKLFSKIPDRFFSVLASGNKELYVAALFDVIDWKVVERNYERVAG